MNAAKLQGYTYLQIINNAKLSANFILVELGSATISGSYDSASSTFGMLFSSTDINTLAIIYKITAVSWYNPESTGRNGYVLAGQSQSNSIPILQFYAPGYETGSITETSYSMIPVSLGKFGTYSGYTIGCGSMTTVGLENATNDNVIDLRYAGISGSWMRRVSCTITAYAMRVNL